jgi:hypothetical protein
MSCSDNQHAFIPFAFDTFDFIAPEVASLLQKVQKVMNNNVVPELWMLFLRELILSFKSAVWIILYLLMDYLTIYENEFSCNLSIINANMLNLY